MTEPLPSDSSTAPEFFTLSSHTMPYAAVHQVYVAELERLCEEEDDDDTNGLVLVDAIRQRHMPNVSRAFYRAGRRSRLHFEIGSNLNAAIVTCGGLCPGLNNVVRELVHCLHHTYEVRHVWGVVGGWNGFGYKTDKSFPEPILLSDDWVESIHHQGGSALKTSRGGLDLDAVVEFLTEREISHLYIIGGDGTHRAAYQVHQACRQRQLHCAVAGIPKTIDNDIAFLDRYGEDEPLCLNLFAFERF